MCREDSARLSRAFKLELEIKDPSEVLLYTVYRPVACAQAPTVVTIPDGWGIGSQARVSGWVRDQGT